MPIVSAATPNVRARVGSADKEEGHVGQASAGRASIYGGASNKSRKPGPGRTRPGRPRRVVKAIRDLLRQRVHGVLASYILWALLTNVLSKNSRLKQSETSACCALSKVLVFGIGPICRVCCGSFFKSRNVLTIAFLAILAIQREEEPTSFFG